MKLVETLNEDAKKEEIKLTCEEVATILDATPLASVEKLTALMTIIIGNARKEKGEFEDFIKEMNVVREKTEETAEEIVRILTQEDKEEEEE